MFTRTLRGGTLFPAYVANPHNGLSPDLLPVTLPFFQTTGLLTRLVGREELPPGPVLDPPVHCKIIRIHCSAIKTLLQLNSNNSNQCDVFIYFAVATCRN